MLTALLVVLVTTLVMVLAYGRIDSQKRSGLRTPSAIAKRLGLVSTSGAEPHGLDTECRGTVDGVDVTITMLAGDDVEVSCRVADRIAWGLGKNGALDKPLKGPDVRTGDPDFDARVRVAGERLAALAFLTRDHRRLVREAVELGWTVDDGVWRLRVGRDGELPPKKVLERGVALAKLARRDPEPERRIYDRMRVESDSGLRLRALEVLLAERPEHELTRDGLKLVLHQSADVAVDAVAMIRGAPHLGYVLASAAPASARAAALVRLAGEHAHHKEAVLGVKRLASAPEQLPTVLGAALARALTRVPYDDPEAVLVKLLDGREDVQIEAARALATCGTITRAVPALLPIRDRFMDSLAKVSARDAIVAIRARAGDVAAGRLSVADETPEGALAMVETDDT